MKVLGIETSCDETAVSLIEASGDFGAYFEFKQLGNALYSQAKLHEQYGGVFPNLAKREHAKNLVPLLAETLRQAGELSRGSTSGSTRLSLGSLLARENPQQGRILPPAARLNLDILLSREPELLDSLSVFFKTYSKPEIDCIALTRGPGLEPCLWVGVNFAKALSLAWNVPIVGVNHMEGHIMLSLMNENRLSEFEFPLLALLISGGHTELALSKELHQYEIVGKTRDDAAGEAFDKVARLLGLPYPGGPEISRLATIARHSPRSQGAPLRFPRPMVHEDNFDFSFSGLKTAVRKIVEQRTLQGAPLSSGDAREIAREFEDATADVLVEKTMRAIDMFGANTIVVGGGVSANKYIRERLRAALEAEGNPAKLLIPPPELATDNALMIALAGYFRALKREFIEPSFLTANGNLKLS